MRSAYPRSGELTASGKSCQKVVAMSSKSMNTRVRSRKLRVNITQIVKSSV
jgi:hypothetical protein